MKISRCFPAVVLRCAACLFLILFVLSNIQPGTAQSAGS